MYYVTLLVYACSILLFFIIMASVSFSWLKQKVRPAKKSKPIPTEVTFSVIANNLQPFELVGLTGSIEALGDWSPDKFLRLHSASNDVWNVSIPTKDISVDNITYRYFTYVRQTNGHIQIRCWETHLHPRSICLSQLSSKPLELEVFGIADDEINIHRGWITHENIIQFKFFSNPFDLVEKNNACIYLKLLPVCVCSGKIIRNPGSVHVEVVQFNTCNNKLVPQKSIGVKLFANSVTMFHVTVAHINQVKFMFEIILSSNFTVAGTFSVLPKYLLDSDGIQNVKITSPKGKIIGSVKFPYMIIKPIASRMFSFKNALAYYWSDKWTGLDYGHRGIGETFNEFGENSETIENTMASFKFAVASKVDGIEIDVLLTKDCVPVIFHDFDITTYLGPGMPSESCQLTKIPICTLTYEELKKITWYKAVADHIYRIPARNDEPCEDCAIFPTLSDFLRIIPQHIGLNLEVKYPQMQLNGEMEGIQDIDKNCYVDIILDELIKDSGTRNILLTSFEADVTIMLRFKQNMFPVAFLSTGITTKWLPALDPRCSTSAKAIMCAQAFELIGISSLIEECLENERVLLKAFALKQIVLLWGDEVASKKIIDKFKKLGVTGLIIDCADKNVSKEKKCNKFNNTDIQLLYKNRTCT